MISAKRAKRDLRVSEVLSTVGNIFVNEMLPSDLYNLLRQTKTRTSQMHYKHDWVSTLTLSLLVLIMFVIILLRIFSMLFQFLKHGFIRIFMTLLSILIITF